MHLCNFTKLYSKYFTAFTYPTCHTIAPILKITSIPELVDAKKNMRPTDLQIYRNVSALDAELNGEAGVVVRRDNTTVNFWHTPIWLLVVLLILNNRPCLQQFLSDILIRMFLGLHQRRLQLCSKPTEILAT